MKTKMIWANLPVKDIERTRKFFLALGFKVNGEPTAEIVSFIIAENEFIINFFQEEQFKTATEIAVTDTKKSAEIIFSLSAESKEDVKEWAETVKKAGGTVFLEPQEIQGNMYNMGFADPDGHRWNVLYC